jgi:hypothetical protein
LGSIGLMIGEQSIFLLIGFSILSLLLILFVFAKWEKTIVAIWLLLLIPLISVKMNYSEVENEKYLQVYELNKKINSVSLNKLIKESFNDEVLINKEYKEIISNVDEKTLKSIENTEVEYFESIKPIDLSKPEIEKLKMVNVLFFACFILLFIITAIFLILYINKFLIGIEDNTEHDKDKNMILLLLLISIAPVLFFVPQEMNNSYRPELNDFFSANSSNEYIKNIASDVKSRSNLKLTDLLKAYDAKNGQNKYFIIKSFK